MSDLHGKFVWYELMTTDLDAAEAFYGAVNGWHTQDGGMSGWRYTIGSVGAAPVVGMMTLPEEVRANGGRPRWLGYIYADDVDATTARVKAAGGAVHKAADDIPGVGRFAVVADPQGAAFVLFKPSGGRAEHPAPGAAGSPGWHELYAGEWQSAFAFYADVFGWEKAEAVDMGPMGLYQLFSVGGVAIGGMMTKPPTIPTPVWGYYFNTDDVDAAGARVTGHGGQMINGPHQVPGGLWIIQCLDPQGAFFALVGARP